MTLGADFLTLEEVRHYMSIEPTDHDEEISDAISSTTIDIIRHCHRDFNDSGSASIRKYKSIRNMERSEWSKYPSILITDDFSTDVGLIVDSDGTTYDNSSLVLEPANGVVQGLGGFPYWTIKGNFPTGELVSVTARWGWSAVPASVRQAAFIMTSDTFQLKDQRLGIAGSDQFGSVVVLRENTLAFKKLKNFRRGSVLVAS